MQHFLANAKRLLLTMRKKSYKSDIFLGVWKCKESTNNKTYKEQHSLFRGLEMRRAYQKQIEQMERDNMYKQQHQHFPSQFNNNPTDPLMGGYNRSVSSFLGGVEHFCDVILCMPHRRLYISLVSM